MPIDVKNGPPILCHISIVAFVSPIYILFAGEAKNNKKQHKNQILRSRPLHLDKLRTKSLKMAQFT